MARPALRALLAGVLLAAAVSPAHAFKWPGGVKIKSSSTGVPVWSGAVTQGATTSTGGGAASMTATQLLNIGGVAAEVTLNRGISAAGVARVAGIGARLLGPAALLTLGYVGLEWAYDHWIVPGDGGVSSVAPCYGLSSYQQGQYPGCIASAADACIALGPGGSANGWQRSTANGTYVVPSAYYVTLAEGQPPGSDGVTTCTGLPKQGDKFWMLYRVEFGTVSGESAPATSAQVDQAIADALQDQPSLAGAIIDHLKNRSQVEAALLEELQAQQVTGPATVPGPSLSGILCARHTMMRRSMYAKQEDDQGSAGSSAANAGCAQGAD